MPELKSVPTSLPKPPYPSDTKANGWKPEFDIRRIKASRTWKLAGDSCRSPLLRLWFESWDNIPAGTWPDDDEFIAISIDVSLEWFTGHKKKLMSGWELHDDGNYYHAYITSQVLQMLEKRTNNNNRQTRFRENRKKKAEACNALVTRDSHVTNAQEQEQEQEKNTTVSDSVLDVDISPTPQTAVGRVKRESAVDDPPDAKDTTRARTSAQAPPTTKKRRSQLNLESLPDDWRQWASEARPDLDLDHVWSVFADHWRGEGEVKANWMATWRNWVRREQGPKRNGQRKLTPWQEQQNKAIEYKRDLTARIAAEDRREREVAGTRVDMEDIPF